MVSSPKVFTNNSTISPTTPTPVNKPSARKSLCLFTNILDAKRKLLPAESDLQNQSSRKLNQELRHGH